MTEAELQAAQAWTGGAAAQGMGPPAVVPGGGEGEDAIHGEEHRELVGQVKMCQRESQAWRDIWSQWSKQNAGNIRDPARLTVGLLRKALHDIGSSTHHLPANPVQQTALEFSSDPEHEMYVMRVKDLQRNGGEEFKDKWYQYVKKNGNNQKDPKQHSKEFLAEALAWIERQKHMAERGIKMGEDGQPTYPDVAQYFLEDLVTAALNRFDQNGAIPNIQEFITEFIATRSLGGIASATGQIGTPVPEPDESAKRFRGDEWGAPIHGNVNPGMATSAPV